MSLPLPRLEKVTADELSAWTDARLSREVGVVVAFSERTGGVSAAPFSDLNLAAHVGDDPSAVDENRRRFLDLMGLARFSDMLTVPQQTHGTSIAFVAHANGGSGALAGRGAAPLEATDALISDQQGIPLMLCFADCVPVVLVAPGPAVAVVHAGWRGALASLPGAAVAALARTAGCDSAEIVVYIGPHIRSCHYEVDGSILSQFVNAFGTLARADSEGLDLEFAVTASLIDAGVATCSIACLGTCTAETTNRYFSHRAEHGLTGRHAALACILPRG